LFVWRRKRLEKSCFNFLDFFVFLHYFLCVFSLSLKSLAPIVPNCLEIFMVIDLLVHNILGSLNLNWILVLWSLRSCERVNKILKLVWLWWTFGMEDNEGVKRRKNWNTY
jgi:hypothetical protein